MSRKCRVKSSRLVMPTPSLPPHAEDDEFLTVTMDVYHSPSVPPDPPDLQTIGRIKEIYSQGRDLDQGGTNNVPSHVIVVGLGVDIRDGDMEIGEAGDKVYIPDQDGIQFEVYAVVRRHHERWCYCRRKLRVSGPFDPL